jgi:hypothetical protein
VWPLEELAATLQVCVLVICPTVACLFPPAKQRCTERADYIQIPAVTLSRRIEYWLNKRVLRRVNDTGDSVGIIYELDPRAFSISSTAEADGDGESAPNPQAGAEVSVFLSTF